MTRPLHHRAAIAAVRTLRPAARLWWRFARPTVMGAFGWVENPAGEVLLVRHTYMEGWHFPGGGVKRREVVRAALLRELREEVGVTPARVPELMGVFTNLADPRSSHVALYRVADFAFDPKPNMEIAEWRFFAPDPGLPGLGRGPCHRFQEARGEREDDGQW
jgi:ADP-ribose pyrophosphatase YjhB (NUDIX family)